MAIATANGLLEQQPPRRIEADSRATSVIEEFHARRRSGRYDRMPAHHQPFEEPYVVRHEVAGVEFDVLVANENAMHWYEDPDRVIATAVYCGEFDVIRGLNLAREGDVVLDCGAHHGVLAGMVAKVVGPTGHVYAFEPSLIGSDLVELNAALNGLQNVTAVRAAVGDTRDTGRFSERDARFGIDQFDASEVPRVVLDDYADTRPGLVKIDVEGAEGAVLAGAERMLASAPNLMLEVHPDWMVESEGTTQEAVVARVDWTRYECFQAIGSPPYARVDRPRLPEEGGWVAARRRTRVGAALRRLRHRDLRAGQPAPAPTDAPEVLAEAGGIKYDLTAVPDDALTKTIQEGNVPGGAVHDAVLRAAKPGTRVIDLGARIGTTALHAAAAGAEVIAVEADPAYAASLRGSANLTGCAVDVVEALAGAAAGTAVYSPAGPWGHVRKVTEIDDVSGPIEVAAIPADELLARTGWPGADVVKLTLSGYEPFALEGLHATLTGPNAPALLALECSAHALTWYDRRPEDLREQLLAIGYQSFLVDQVQPERAMPTEPSGIQPYCVSALLAVRQPQTLEALGYEIAPYSDDELAERLLSACVSDGATDRWHAVREIERGPGWPREDPRLVEAVERLHRDPTGIVRDAAWWANEARVGADTGEAAASADRMTAMEVPGAGQVMFALPPGAVDPVTRELELEDEYPPHGPNHLFRALLRPGMTVLDLGANLGAFALPAAALGARVVAVDAHPQHARLLEASVQANGFEDRMTVVHAAIADEPEVDLVCMFGWSSLEPIAPCEGFTRDEFAALARAPRVRVRALATRDALAEAGVSRVDLIKMDLEGAEPQAVAGMVELLEGADAPPVLFEVCSTKLQVLGSSVRELLTEFAQLGYRLHRLEESKEERLLVPITPDVFLPDPSDDVLAVKYPPEVDGWRVREPLSRHDQVDRTLEAARSPFRSTRRVLAAELRRAPSWLLRDPLTREALRALRHDVDPAVRTTAAWSADLA